MFSKKMFLLTCLAAAAVFAEAAPRENRSLLPSKSDLLEKLEGVMNGASSKFNELQNAALEKAKEVITKLAATENGQKLSELIKEGSATVHEEVSKLLEKLSGTDAGKALQAAFEAALVKLADAESAFSTGFQDPFARSAVSADPVNSLESAVAEAIKFLEQNVKQILGTLDSLEFAKQIEA